MMSEREAIASFDAARAGKLVAAYPYRDATAAFHYSCKLARAMDRCDLWDLVQASNASVIRKNKVRYGIVYVVGDAPLSLMQDDIFSAIVAFHEARVERNFGLSDMIRRVIGGHLFIHADSYEWHSASVEWPEFDNVPKKVH